jgi:3-oxoadipate enol-lactonase
MTFKTSDGVELFYEIEGEGFPILFLNGMWGDTSTWKNSLPYYTNLFTCIRLEHRGIGRSERWVGEYSYDLHARDVVDLLDHLNIQHVHIVGTCHGGMVATTVGKNYPDRVGVLAINGTQLLKSERSSAVFRGWREMLEKIGFEALYRYSIIPAIFSEKFILENKERLDGLVLGTLARISKESALGLIEAAVQFGMTKEEIEEIKVPALLMSSDEDLFSAPFTIEKVAEYWRGSEYFMFQGCAHFPQREIPAEYNTLVKEYLLKKTLELS